MERYHTIFQSESEFSANQACLQLEAEQIPVILSYVTDEQLPGASSFKVMVPTHWQQRGVHLLLSGGSLQAQSTFQSTSEKWLAAPSQS